MRLRKGTKKYQYSWYSKKVELYVVLGTDDEKVLLSRDGVKCNALPFETVKHEMFATEKEALLYALTVGLSSLGFKIKTCIRDLEKEHEDLKNLVETMKRHGR